MQQSGDARIPVAGKQPSRRPPTPACAERPQKRQLALPFFIRPSVRADPIQKRPALSRRRSAASAQQRATDLEQIAHAHLTVTVLVQQAAQQAAAQTALGLRPLTLLPQGLPQSAGI
ncbi:Uncharacterised protein [Comamonas terrigena]|nr:Uncharacterised protein [Comamonas terrigena]